MSIKILMPALSPTMKDGNLTKWLVKVGDKVKPGDVIAEIETDKATMEVEAVDGGVITHMLEINPGQSVPVNSTIALINGDPDDKITNNEVVIKSSKESKFKKEFKDFDKENIQENKKLLNKQKIFNDKNKIIASPFAKFFSKNNDINLENVKGSGPNGRIIKKDIINLKTRDEAYTILREHKIIDPSNIRNIIANRTAETKKNVPHYYLTIESNVGKLINLRKKINENNENKISYNDIMVKALALAIQNNKSTNVSWINNKIYQYSSIDISIAVALKEGLITPIIKDADKKNLNEISLEIKNLIQKSIRNDLKPEEYIGGSITISNLGMYGITEFAAIINPPQSAILALGKINKKPIIENNSIELGYTIKSTLSVDHRVLDGAVAGKLLKDFNDIIEDPFKIWLESNDLKVI